MNTPKMSLLCRHTAASLQAQPFPTPESNDHHPAGFWHKNIKPTSEMPSKINAWIRQYHEYPKFLLEILHPIYGYTRGWILCTQHNGLLREIYREAIFKAGTANDEITDAFALLIQKKHVPQTDQLTTRNR